MSDANQNTTNPQGVPNSSAADNPANTPENTAGNIRNEQNNPAPQSGSEALTPPAGIETTSTPTQMTRPFDNPEALPPAYVDVEVPDHPNV